jgi:hypothetical protein
MKYQLLPSLWIFSGRETGVSLVSFNKSGSACCAAEARGYFFPAKTPFGSIYIMKITKPVIMTSFVYFGGAESDRTPDPKTAGRNMPKIIILDISPRSPFIDKVKGR